MNPADFNRRDFLKTAGLAAAAIMLGGCAEQDRELLEKISRSRPNILLIITDDQGWGDVHSHGNSLIDTPVMDKFAEEVTIAEILKDNGYVTGCFGKWHLGSNYPYHPNAQGFDEFVGFCSGHWNNYFDTTLERNGEFFKSKGYISDVLTDHAIRFLEINKNRPFFLYLAYNAPHVPIQSPKGWLERVKRRQKNISNKRASIVGMIEHLDDGIGKVINALKKSG